MKKVNFTIQGNKYEVEILSLENNIAQVEVNGTPYEVEIEEKIKSTKTPKLVRSTVVPSTELGASLKTNKPSGHKGAGLVKAPLPGLILSVSVKEGDIVKIGDRLLIMEAMKMENNINSDKEGKVISVKIKTGDIVLEGDVLVEIGG